ncbi:MAG: DM13 domain-containing protein [Actinomycetota bacterium]|nr:DM13 domain-containing protein [Actinomycetota bacterium]
MILVPVAIIAVGALTVGMYLFQPWKLFTDTTVNEPSPIAASAPVEAIASPTTSPAPSREPSRSAAPSAASSPAPATKAAKVLTTGKFISHEHGTSGTAKIISLADGSRVLRIENLDTSNGPDLKVWLTDAPVIEGPSGWFVFDDGAYVDLGALKGNKGSQNYKIPAKANLSKLTSVTIWCDRFSVSFGAAELQAPSA